jgi:D-arabinose 1-dehydrogenase-like Zn-dependent alcohol dehydrogenase
MGSKLEKREAPSRFTPEKPPPLNVHHGRQRSTCTLPRFPHIEQPSMKNARVIITAHGGPEVLKLIEEDVPEPRAGDVRLKVLATGVAFCRCPHALRHVSQHAAAPLFPRLRRRRVIDKPGDTVSAFTVGERVAVLITTGGYSQYLCLPTRELTQVPDGVDPAEAVSLVLNYVTAHHSSIASQTSSPARVCSSTALREALAPPCSNSGSSSA